MNIDATTPQLMAVKKYLEAITTFDVSKVIALSSRNFKYQSFPKSIDLPEIREQEMEAHIQWLNGLLALLTKLEITAHEVIEAPGKVVIHMTVMIYLVDGTTYDYDSLTIISLVEEDGEIKVLENRDFSDPYKRGAFYARIAKIAGQGTPVS